MGSVIRSRATRAATIAVCLAFCSPRPPAAAADAFADAIAAEKKGLVTRLESLATWCDGKRLAGERDRVFRLILRFDPEHVRARTALKFTRAGKGKPWVQSPEYREPADWDKGNLVEAAARRRAAASAFVEKALAALSAVGAEVPPGRREEVIETAIDVAPDNGDIRRERGDVERNGRWFLAETIDAEQRRADVSSAVRAAEDAAPRAAADPGALATGWKVAYRTESYQVMGKVPTEECIRVLRNLEVGRRFFAGQIGDSGGEPWPRIVYVYEDREAARRFLAKYPQFEDFDRIKDEVAGGALPDGSYIGYFSSPARRTTAPISAWMERELSRLFPKSKAWVGQGFSQLLCWRAFRAHPPHSVNIGGTDRPQDLNEDEEVALPEPTANWMPAAAAVLSRQPVRRVRSLLTMNLNAMRSGDLLTACALASYLFEGRYESLEGFLAAAADSDDPDAMCRAALGVDADTLAWRLRRFALETASAR